MAATSIVNISLFGIHLFGFRCLMPLLDGKANATFKSSTLKLLSNSSIIQKTSVTSPLATINYIIRNHLIFNYKHTDYQPMCIYF